MEPPVGLRASGRLGAAPAGSCSANRCFRGRPFVMARHLLRRRPGEIIGQGLAAVVHRPRDTLKAKPLKAPAKPVRKLAIKVNVERLVAHRVAFHRFGHNRKRRRAPAKLALPLGQDVWAAQVGEDLFKHILEAPKLAERPSALPSRTKSRLPFVRALRCLRNRLSTGAIVPAAVSMPQLLPTRCPRSQCDNLVMRIYLIQYEYKFKSTGVGMRYP